MSRYASGLTYLQNDGEAGTSRRAQQAQWWFSPPCPDFGSRRIVRSSPDAPSRFGRGVPDRAR